MTGRKEFKADGETIQAKDSFFWSKAEIQVEGRFQELDFSAPLPEAVRGLDGHVLQFDRALR
jgi:hypothetical protein